MKLCTPEVSPFPPCRNVAATHILGTLGSRAIVAKEALRIVPPLSTLPIIAYEPLRTVPSVSTFPRSPPVTLRTDPPAKIVHRTLPVQPRTVPSDSILSIILKDESLTVPSFSMHPTIFSCLLQFEQCVQPYFPSQATFSIDDDHQTIMAIDPVNQNSYQTSQERGYDFVMKNFPYTIPDSPESENFVELSTIGIIIHSANHTNETEKCSLYSGAEYPCEEIYFIKNTEILLRTTHVVHRGLDSLRVVTNYGNVSICKPHEELFGKIPKDWAYNCQDVTLGLEHDPEMSKVDVNQSASVQLRLTSPLHCIYGNDTVILEWQPSKNSSCMDCVSWKPERLYFNSVKFEEPQELIVTRVENGDLKEMIPVFHGGRYESVFADAYSIYIE
ncbi:unnamed protein product [Rotaria socialis]|uniref:Uncharacterized protein n=2 Tax=Rotaria socialis TaxID=392032 RepID=A0A820GBP9_9BILA|nr:unnamed protein product [Rotaria socialis]